MASSAGTTRRDDALAGRGLSLVKPPEPLEQLAGVLGELLTWLRARNPQPAAPDPVEAMHARCLMLDPPETAEVARAKFNATLARLRVRCGKIQLRELTDAGLTVRLEGGQLLVSPARLVTDELKVKLERWREYLLIALNDSDLGK